MAPRLLAAAAYALCWTHALAWTRLPLRAYARRTTVTASTAAYEIDGKPVAGPLKPLSNFLLVQVRAAEEETAGGVFLPDKAQEKPTEGVVADLGPGRIHPETGVVIPIPVEQGEHVLYGKYDGTAVEYCKDEYILIRDDDILLAWPGGSMSVDNVRPVRDRILIKTTEKSDATASGIMLAPSAAAQARVTVGQVIATGSGQVAANGEVSPHAMEVVPGDFIKYRDYGGSEVTLDGEDYMIIKMSDCLCKWAGA